MNKDIIQDIWGRGKSTTKEINMKDFEQAIRPSISRHTFSFKLFIWIWLCIIFTTMVLGGMNIEAYSMNPSMLFAELVITITAMIFGFYGIHLLGELKIINRAEESLVSMLKRRLRFYRSKYEIWNVMMAAMIPLLSFAFITYIDNQQGVYRINKPFIFWGVTLIQFIFGYVIIKFSHYPILKEIKIYLADLEAQVWDGTHMLTAMKKRWRFWGYIFVIVAALLLLWGIWRAIQL